MDKPHSKLRMFDGYKISEAPENKEFVRVVNGLDQSGGDARTKEITHRIVTDLFKTIDALDIKPDEFWAAVSYISDLGASCEAGLLAPGLGLEHFLDLTMDSEDKEKGVKTGTPRTIEGPLYVAGAPLSQGEARLDDGTEQGEILIPRGVVRSVNGKQISGAIVDVWHANTKGLYSFFDRSQRKYNLRRRIRTGADGRYSFRRIIPAGYGCPPNGPTQRLLNQIGRHGQRPAHIHFFVSSPGYRKLTGQINIPGDKYLYDDFAFATREGLIPDVKRVGGRASGNRLRLRTDYRGRQSRRRRRSPSARCGGRVNRPCCNVVAQK